MSVEIRFLGRSDAPLAVRTAERFRGVELSLDAAARFAGDERHHIVVALEDGEPVGYAVAYTLPRFDGGGPMLHVYELAVDERHRRQGIGRRIVHAMLDQARSIGASRMWLGTNRSNVAGRALYDSTGGEVNAGGEDDLTYHWPRDNASRRRTGLP